MGDPVGILNIDKPAGITSHDVVARVRRVAQMKRVGHAGTLDPLATGVLVVCLGRATRLVEYLVGRPKTYIARIRFGQTTDTYDADGDVVAEQPVTIDASDIEVALPPFRGPIQQVPPMYSAIKRNGQPLYKLARQGKEVERPPRSVTIYTFELTAWEAPFADVTVTCSAGTYIRSLAHDLGNVLGCGGHLTMLRRTQVGAFGVDSGVPLAELDAERLTAALHPADLAVAHLPRLDWDDAHVRLMFDGKRIPIVGEPAGSLVRIYAPDGSFAGLIRPDAGSWRAVKLFPPITG